MNLANSSYNIRVRDGVVTLDRIGLRDLIRKGEVLPDTQIATVNTEEWRPADTYKELTRYFALQADSLPPPPRCPICSALIPRPAPLLCDCGASLNPSALASLPEPATGFSGWLIALMIYVGVAIPIAAATSLPGLTRALERTGTPSVPQYLLFQQGRSTVIFLLGMVTGLALLSKAPRGLALAKIGLTILLVQSLGSIVYTSILLPGPIPHGPRSFPFFTAFPLYSAVLIYIFESPRVARLYTPAA